MLRIALVKATNLILIIFFNFQCFIDFTSGCSEVVEEKAKVTGNIGHGKPGRKETNQALILQDLVPHQRIVSHSFQNLSFLFNSVAVLGMTRLL